MKRLENKKAVITGANSGIGSAAARRFAKEGADVALLDLNTSNLPDLAQEIEAQGRNALILPCDVTDASECESAIAHAAEMFGRIDILVNSAGILDYNRSVLNTDEALWDQVIAINQSGIFYCCRAVLRYMEKQEEGAIVNVSSMAGITANAGAAYTASKHAVISLSKNIAIQYGGTAIRCNVVCPGRTDTPMNASQEYFQQMDHEFMEIGGRHAARYPGKIPPEAQADAILFFASDEARYVTGQWLCVDQGSSKHY